LVTVSDVSLSFGEKPLFKEVNLKFTPGNCYGIIGANGAGKSTFLKVLSGELEHDRGDIIITPGERMAVLKQDHFAYDEYSVMDTVMMGHPKLYKCYKDREEIYAKEDFTEEDGIKASELEGEFSELGGWEAENQIEQMLSGLGLEEDYHGRMMSELDESQKVRVLLAQAIFGEPDILLLDEPTNGLDLESIAWLEEFLIDFPNTVIVVSHDRHFLNAVCTCICDIDYGKITPFAGNYDLYKELGVEVIGISKDSSESHMKFAQKHDLPFVLLSDPERTVHEVYDVLKEKKSGGKVTIGTVRTTYIINEEGVIEKVMAKVKPDTNAADVLEYLRG
jgi:ATPase subunit of ABC transporter with duplicated ATPase domains